MDKGYDRKNTDLGNFRAYREPFMICPQNCSQGWTKEGECRTCQGQGYIPEDWRDLDAWIPWGKA